MKSSKRNVMLFTALMPLWLLFLWFALSLSCSKSEAANLRGTIYASANNGPFVYTFEVDGALKYNVNGIASAGAAFDSLKARVGNEPGTVIDVKFRVSSSLEEMAARLRQSVANGPYAYWFEADGTWKTVVNNVASVGAGADAIKALVGAEGGSIIKVVVLVATQ